MSPSPQDEEIAALRLEVAALRFERDFLLAQRDATRAWLGDELTRETPLDPSLHLSLNEFAHLMFKRYPDKKIVAIKELRMYSHRDSWSGPRLSLVEARDMINAAFEGRL